MSPLPPDDEEAHLAGWDEPLVRRLSGDPGTREAVEAHFPRREQWGTAGPLRAFGIRMVADEVLAGSPATSAASR
ncbi:hypothetical protein ACF1G0_21815 [Streptomyces sp. NPDC013953]|uniref:hypothetical protein n=1 Tax=Streptomyces sp. NPDC013953 TaxID=3364868 RepID=UPI0036FE74B8